MGMVERLYLGIDPGSQGGFVTIQGDSITSFGMPDTEADVCDYLKYRAKSGQLGGGIFCFLEKVGGFMGGSGEDGAKKNIASGHTMFKFGRGVGLIVGALVSYGIPFEEISPQSWQKALKIPPKTRSESKTQWKNRLKAKAQTLFPKEKVTLQTADAFLIAEHCRRTRNKQGD